MGGVDGEIGPGDMNGEKRVERLFFRFFLFVER